VYLISCSWSKNKPLSGTDANARASCEEQNNLNNNHNINDFMREDNNNLVLNRKSSFNFFSDKNEKSKKNMKIKMMSTNQEYIVEKVGVFTPKATDINELNAGEIGFITTGIKVLSETKAIGKK
jgi:hypothetical protein